MRLLEEEAWSGGEREHLMMRRVFLNAYGLNSEMDRHESIKGLEEGVRVCVIIMQSF